MEFTDGSCLQCDKCIHGVIYLMSQIDTIVRTCEVKFETVTEQPKGCQYFKPRGAIYYESRSY